MGCIRSQGHQGLHEHGALADVFLEKLACEHYRARGTRKVTLFSRGVLRLPDGENVGVLSCFADKKSGRIFVDFVTYTLSLILYLQVVFCL